MKRIIFNSSMPRSGSELLQVLLHQNPKIYASTTSPLLEFQFGARGNLGLPEVMSQDGKLMEKAFNSMCAGMAQSYYGAITDKPIICDKSRGWIQYYEWVAQWQPNPKMICLVRDLRSILASMERIYRKNRHMPIGPDDPAKLQCLTVEQRVQYWLNTQPVGLALSRVCDLFQRNLTNKVLFIRYEDLTVNPQSQLDRVYEFIGEPSFKHDFKNVVKTVIENDTVFGPYGNHNVGNVVIPYKKNDWEDMLSPGVANGILQDNSWYFTSFGY